MYDYERELTRFRYLQEMLNAIYLTVSSRSMINKTGEAFQKSLPTAKSSLSVLIKTMKEEQADAIVKKKIRAVCDRLSVLLDILNVNRKVLRIDCIKKEYFEILESYHDYFIKIYEVGGSSDEIAPPLARKEDPILPLRTPQTFFAVSGHGSLASKTAKSTEASDPDETTPRTTKRTRT